MSAIFSVLSDVASSVRVTRHLTVRHVRDNLVCTQLETVVICLFYNVILYMLIALILFESNFRVFAQSRLQYLLRWTSFPLLFCFSLPPFNPCKMLFRICVLLSSNNFLRCNLMLFILQRSDARSKHVKIFQKKVLLGRVFVLQQKPKAQKSWGGGGDFLFQLLIAIIMWNAHLVFVFLFGYHFPLVS